MRSQVGHLLDIELALPISFVLFATAGLVYAAFATYLYFRFERSAAEKHVPFAISVFAVHYVLVFSSGYAQRDVFLSTFLLFLMALTLLLVIWLGSQAQSKAGIRMVLAGVFTLAALVCRIGHDIYQSTKFHQDVGTREARNNRGRYGVFNYFEGAETTPSFGETVLPY